MGWISDVRKAARRADAWQDMVDRDAKAGVPDGDPAGDRRNRRNLDARDDLHRAIVRRPKGGR